MHMFYDYLAATAGVVTGVLGTLFVLGIGACAVVLGIAAIFNAFQARKRTPKDKIGYKVGWALNDAKKGQSVMILYGTDEPPPDDFAPGVTAIRSAVRKGGGFGNGK